MSIESQADSHFELSDTVSELSVTTPLNENSYKAEELLGVLQGVFVVGGYIGFILYPGYTDGKYQAAASLGVAIGLRISKHWPKHTSSDPLLPPDSA